MIRIFFIFALVAFNPQSALAKSSQCSELDEIFTHSHFLTLTEVQKQEAQNSMDLSESQRLAAFCFETKCFIAKLCEDPLVVIDISGVVTGNLGKIGWDPEYDRIENRPLLTSENWNKILAKWVNDKSIASIEPDDPNTFGSYIRTRIWKNGQRYTVYEPMLIVNDKPMYR